MEDPLKKLNPVLIPIIGNLFPNKMAEEITSVRDPLCEELAAMLANSRIEGSNVIITVPPESSIGRYMNKLNESN